MMTRDWNNGHARPLVALADLPALARRSAEAAAEFRAGVRRARDQRLSWEQIAKVLGVTRQAAWERRTLPTTGAPAPKTWVAYAEDLKAWVQFLRCRSLELVDDSKALAEAVAAYHAERQIGRSTGSGYDSRQTTCGCTFSIP